MSQENNNWCSRIEEALIKQQSLNAVLKEFDQREWNNFIKVLVEEAEDFKIPLFSFDSPIVYFATRFRNLCQSSRELIGNAIESVLNPLGETPPRINSTIEKSAENAFFIAYATPINIKNRDLLKKIAFNQNIYSELRTNAALIIASQDNILDIDLWKKLINTDEETTLAPIAIDVITENSTILAVEFLSELKTPPIDKIDNFEIVIERLLQKILDDRESSRFSLGSFPDWCKDYIIELIEQSKFQQLADEWIHETAASRTAIDTLAKQSTKLAVNFLSELQQPSMDRVDHFRVVVKKLLQKILDEGKSNQFSLGSFPDWCKDYIIELVKQAKFSQLDDEWIRSNSPDYLEYEMSKCAPTNTRIPPRSYAINIDNDEIANDISRLLSDSTIHRGFITGLNQGGKNGSGIGLTSRAISIYRRYSQGNNKDEFESVIFIDSHIKKISQMFRVIGDELNDELIKNSDNTDVVIDNLRRRYERNNKKTLLIIDDFDEKLSYEKNKLGNFLVNIEDSCKVLLTTRSSNAISCKTFNFKSNSKEIQLPLLTVTMVNRILKSSQKQNVEFITKCYLGNPLAISLAIATDSELTTCPIPQEDPDPVWYSFQESIKSLDELSKEILILVSVFHKSEIFHNPFLSKEALEQILSDKFDKIQINESIQTLQNRNLLLSNDELNEMPNVGISDSISKCVLRFEKIQNSEMKMYENDIFRRLTEYYIIFTNDYGGSDWNNRHDFEKIGAEWYNILAVLEWNQRNDKFEEINKIWFKVNRFADLYGYWEDRKKWLEILINRYKYDDDSNIYARCLSSKGWTLTMLGSEFYEEAQKVLEEALELKSIELVTKLNLVHNITILYYRRGQESDNTEARKYYDKAKAKIVEQQKLYKDIECEFKKGNIDNFTEADLQRHWINYVRDNAKIKFLEKNWTDAHREYSACLDMCIKVKWTRMTSYCHYMLAETLLNLDRDPNEEKLQEVLEHISKGVAIAKENCNKRRLGYFKKSYARLQDYQGNREKSEHWNREAENDFKMLISDLSLC